MRRQPVGIAATAGTAAAKAAEEAHQAEADVKHAAATVEKTAQKAAVVADTKVTAAAAKVAPVARVQAGSPGDGNVQQWAKWLADQLRRVPEIQVYDAVTLSDLARRGPAPARVVWETAQAVLGKDYGSMTVGDLLKRFAP